MSFRASASSGVKWCSVSQFGRQGMQILTTIILARLLSASDFGLTNMAMVVCGFVGIFKDLGTSAAIIQRKNITEEMISSIFWTNVIFGSLAMVILFIAAPIVAKFYSEPRLIPILEVLSFTFIISSFGTTHQAILEREMEFQKLAKAEIWAITMGSFTGVGTALLGAGVWSLVYQSLAVVVATTVLLWVSSSWRPKFIIYWTEIKSVCNYSLNLTGFNIFNYFARNADNLLIGKFLGAQNLGYYSLAYRFMLYPIQSISGVIGRVTFPIYSQIQNENERFKNAYLKVVGTISLITFPMMLGLIVLSEHLVLTLFGSQWSQVNLLLKILAPVGMVQSLVTTVGAIYQAKGRTDWLLRWGIGSGLLATIAFAIGIHWGIIGVATAYSVISLLLIYPNFAIPFRLINLEFRRLGEVIWRPFINSMLMVLILFGLKYIMPDEVSSGLVLVILVPTGIISHLFASWIINRDQMKEILGIVR